MRSGEIRGRVFPTAGTLRTLAVFLGTVPMRSVPIDNLLPHAAFVRALAHDLTRDPHDGDDLEQEAWLQAMRRPPRHGESLRRWFTALLGSLHKNHRRTERRRWARERQASPTCDGDPVDAIIAKEQASRRLFAAVLRLPEPFRAAVLLRYYEGLSAAEIATRIDVPAATVRTRVARGLERLRAELDADHRGDRTAWAVPLAAITGAPSPGPLTLTTVLAMKKLVVALVAALVVASFVFSRPLRSPLTQLPHAALADAAGSAPAMAATAGAASPASVQRVALPQAAPDGTGVLEVVALWQADKQPASSQAIDVIRAGEVDAELAPRRLVTDASGRVVFEALVPGRVSVQTSTGVRQDVELVSGERTVATLLLDGIPLRGRVVDSHDQPVADAEVWVSSDLRYPTGVADDWAGFGQYGERTLRTDATGSFATRLAGTQCVAAFKAGYGPSATVYATRGMRTAPSEPVPCTLRLTRESGVLTVRVVDGAARPVRGAVVMVGSEVPTLTDPVTATTPALRATTNADGLAEFATLPVGTLPMQVRATGFAPSVQNVVLVAGTPTRADVTVTMGATIRGVVTDAFGAPLPQAIVRCGEGMRFATMSTRTDASGAYVLANVPPGNRELRAYHAEWGDVRLQLAAADGAVLEQDVRMPPRASILGVVLDAAGQPAAAAVVFAFGDRGVRPARATADASGVFRIVPLDPGGTYQLRAEIKLAGGGITVATLTGVLAGSSVELRPRAADTPTARLRGRVLKPDRTPAVGYGVLVMPGNESAGSRVEVGHDGAFELGPWQPTSVRIAVVAAGANDALAEFGVIAMRAGETTNTGDLVLPVPGSAVVRFARGAHERVFASLFRDGHCVRRSTPTAGELRWNDLQPGDYSVSLLAPGATPALAACDFTVGSGTEVVRDVALTEAARRTLRLELPDGRPSGPLLVQATAPTGHVHPAEVWLEPDSTTCRLALPADTVKVVLTSHDGLRGEVVGNAVAGDPIDVRLRRLR